MIEYLVVFGCGCLSGAVIAGFFWAQFIYTHSKQGESDVR